MQGTSFVQVKMSQQQPKEGFGKVIKMVTSMSSNLKAAQGDDDEQLEFCKSELETAGDSLKEVQQKDKLIGQEIKTLGNDKVAKAKQIEDNDAKVAAQDKMVEEAGATRKEENAKFTQVSSEQTMAISLIEKAKTVLGGVYGPEKQESLVQQQPAPGDEEMSQMP